VEFAHTSEHQFARLLDFYDIRWDYEPREFAVEWDGEGDATKFFRPDFYLPDEDQYIEITTMNQKLVTKKNRKVRRLHELYPDVRCKVFYQRDYLHLLVKYGLEELNDQEIPEAPTRIPGPLQVLDLGHEADPGQIAG
jgi:hypoxanthine phosphoribosyltransferase